MQVINHILWGRACVRWGVRARVYVASVRTQILLAFKSIDKSVANVNLMCTMN